ncbi:MAG: tRNA 5-methoxyuridine(34)/uridine 5-oxyacetic acid(34) synthase CmoB [Bdellovibrio sp.]
MEIRLSYLEQLPGKIDFHYLRELTLEKDRWKEHKGQAKWLNFFINLPHVKNIETNFSLPAPKFSSPEADSNLMGELALKLSPWKKGPFNFFGNNIDSEWRSDFKWDRMTRAKLDYHQKNILDIGCNNGYFMFKLLEHKPKMVLGVDPIIPCMHQFNFINHYIENSPLHFELWGADDIKAFENSFDIILYMGILYHHRNPLEQLLYIRNALVPSGHAIIETIGIPGDVPTALTPLDSYAGMKNVYFLPTLKCLEHWLIKIGFINIEVVDISKTDDTEQRATDWAQKKSLIDGLNAENLDFTKEGYPAPLRFMLKVQKK